MGIVPVWGFQLIIAITAAIFFRLNKAIVILAANISVPPMIPLIIYLSHVTGKIWMGDQAADLLFTKTISLDTIQNSLMQYFAGAVTLAVLAGVFFGALTFSILKAAKRTA